ncbi:lipid A export permease/ATP-binding protein MsbA [Pelagibaculum spongiae]|uniref:Lipid A export permease/ATP-binding protein MsbA n=1 Tax=Pelagibaculum spongiae TaxID=2080658 RepID=A0A2V1GXC2_9GAMM|nr:lipid A export permease/ATP-binding protein MsbA [Pelagibaculum spongiae]PVZ70670.1 lipid A export permease/ATP-binding protein MsbA [Pelagibaculum spongiae]
MSHQSSSKNQKSSSKKPQPDSTNKNTGSNQEDLWQVYLRLLDYIKQHKGAFALSMFGFVLFAISQPGFAQLMEYFVEGLQGDDDSLIYLVPVGAIALAVFRGIGSYLGNYYLAKVSLDIVHKLRSEMFQKLMGLPLPYFEKYNSGHIISKLTYNVEQVTSAATEALKIMVREGFTVIALLVYLFWNNWKLTFILLILGPVIAFIVKKASKKFRAISKRIQESVGDVTHIASETIRGIDVVKGFSAEQQEANRFSDASKNNRDANVRLARNQSIFTPTLQILVVTAMAGIMFLVLLMRNEASPAELVAFITAAGMLPKPVRQLSETNARMQRGLVAAASVFDVIDETPEADNGQLLLSACQGKIDIKNLGFTYPEQDKAALIDINLSIHPGQTVALVGSSGSGKTTLTKLVSRFLEPTEGEIQLDSTPIQKITREDFRKQIALVNQNVILFSDSVRKNIAYGELALQEQQAVDSAAEQAQALDFINNLPDQMETVLSENGASLSGGQRQRLAIARALLKDAPVLILDEATSALDSESEAAIQQALEIATQDRTTLVVAHRLSTIRNADVIVVMDQGKIVETGSHQQLLDKKGAYYRLHSLQYFQS